MVITTRTFSGKTGGVIVTLDRVGLDGGVAFSDLPVILRGFHVGFVFATPPVDVLVGGVSTTGADLDVVFASWEASAIPDAFGG